MTDKASITATSPAQRICNIVRYWWPNRTVDTRYGIIDDSVRIYARGMEPEVLAAALLTIARDKINGLPAVLIVVQGKDADEAFVNFKWLAREAVNRDR